MTDAALRAEFEAWYESPTRPFDARDCSAEKAAWEGYRAGAARVGIAREPVAVPPIVLDALRLYVRESAAFSMGESNDAASAESDFAIVAKTWLLGIDAAREQPPRAVVCPACHGCGFDNPAIATSPCRLCGGGGQVNETPSGEQPPQHDKASGDTSGAAVPQAARNETPEELTAAIERVRAYTKGMSAEFRSDIILVCAAAAHLAAVPT